MRPCLRIRCVGLSLSCGGLAEVYRAGANEVILVANEVISRLDVAQEGRPLSMGE
jgi:hypothetical protein